MISLQMRLLNTLQEYNRLILRIIDLGAAADCGERERLSGILKKLRGSLQKLQFECKSGKIRRYAGSPARCAAALQPYVDFLETTKAEIEKAGGKNGDYKNGD